MKVHGAGLECSALYSALKLTGDEGGEDKDEGRVGVRSDNHPKHHKRGLADEGRNLDWARAKGGYILKVSIF